MNEHQVMALAAMCQVAKQVQKIAQYGSSNDYELEKLLSSIVETTPDSPADVYQGTANLRAGYQCLIEQLSGGFYRSQGIKWILSLLNSHCVH